MRLKDAYKGRMDELLDPELGNPALLVRHVLAHGIVDRKNLIVGGTFDRYAESLGRQVMGPNPTPLERMAAELLVVLWVDVYRRMVEAESTESVMLQAHREKGLTAAVKRLTMAVNMLDKLKRTDLSGLLTIMGSGNAVQVNVDANGKPAVQGEPMMDVTPTKGARVKS